MDERFTMEKTCWACGAPFRVPAVICGPMTYLERRKRTVCGADRCRQVYDEAAVEAARTFPGDEAAQAGFVIGYLREYRALRALQDGSAEGRATVRLREEAKDGQPPRQEVPDLPPPG